MTPEIRRLVKEATIFGSEACKHGLHRWEPFGGRACPHGFEEDANCSQPVMRCGDCGDFDYGDHPQSPGEQHCRLNCQHGYKYVPHT